MSVPNPFPINIPLKVNSPELLAFFQQFGLDQYLSADEINKIKLGLDFLYENVTGVPLDGITTFGTITRAGNVFTFSVGFSGPIIGVMYANTAPFNITIPAASAGKYRMDLAVLNQSNQIVRVPGTESDDVVIETPVPENTIFITKWLVFGDFISDETPINLSLYVEKRESVQKNIFGSGAITIPLNSQETNFRIISSGITMIEGTAPTTQYLTANFNRDNKLLFFKIDSPNPVVFKHSLDANNFRCLGGVNFTAQPGEIVVFRQAKVNVLCYEFLLVSRDVGATPSWQDVISQNGIVEINSGSNATYLDYGSPGSIEEQLFNSISFLTHQRGGGAIQTQIGRVDETRNTIFFQTSDEFELWKYKTGGEIIFKFQDPISSSGSVFILVPSKAIGGNYVLATVDQIPIINERYKGTYTTEAALNIAHPTASAGDEAIVDGGIGVEPVKYYWDASDNQWVAGSGTSPVTTDALTEGVVNLYFTVARALAAALSGISFSDGSNVNASDTILQALGKLQAQLTAVKNPYLLCLSSDYTLSSVTTPQKLFNVGASGNGEHIVEASTLYKYELYVDLTGLSSTSGFFSFSIAGTATFTSLKLYTEANKVALITGSAFFGKIENTSAYQMTTANINTVGYMKVKGTIRVNTGGTIRPTITLSQASAASVKLNSYSSCVPIGSSSFTHSSNTD